jgi:hypothetical protein
LIKLRSHFLSHAGNIAKKKFEKTQETEWAKKWYESYLKSAEISIELEPEHSAYGYGFAEEAAKNIFENTQELEWAKKWYESCFKSAEMFFKIKKKKNLHLNMNLQEKLQKKSLKTHKN